MYEIVPIPPTDLVLDQENARIGEVQPSQPATYVALARMSPKALMGMCRDIVDLGGLDPISPVAVMATGDKHRKYRVLEGNRRVLALKVLETPTLLIGKKILTNAQERKLQTLAARYQADPVLTVNCVLFESMDAASHWIVLRHTGANDGAGLREWGASEKENFRLRHGHADRATTALQVVRFLEKAGDGPLPPNTRIATTLVRLMSTPEVRAAYGLDFAGGELIALYPAEVIAPGLRSLVDELSSKRLGVGDVYTAKQRRAFAGSAGKVNPLDENSRLGAPVTLTGLAAGVTESPATKSRRRRPKVSRERTTIVPASCMINPTLPRLNDLFNELSTLDVDTYPNAGACLLRVFLELSVDREIIRLKLMSEAQRRNAPLAKRMKDLAAELTRTGRIDGQLEKAVIHIADGQNVIAASTTTFNQYVHNPFVLPSPREIRLAWTQLEPFLEAITT